MNLWDDLLGQNPQTDSPKWRLGTTSCVYSDDIVETVSRLAGLVKDVQLVLFETPEISNWPSPEEISKLRDLAQCYDITYTVHIPSALGTVRCDNAWEEREIALVNRTIEKCAALDPLAYVWHWEAERMGNPPADDVSRWLEATARVAQRVANANWVEPHMLAVENLSYDFDLIAPLALELGFSLALDIGHLWRGDFDWENYLHKYGLHCRVVHLHGVDSDTKNDHLSLAYQDITQVRRLGEIMKTWPEKGRRSLILEVFSAQDWLDSRSWLERAWK